MVLRPQKDRSVLMSDHVAGSEEVIIVVGWGRTNSLGGWVVLQFWWLFLDSKTQTHN